MPQKEKSHQASIRCSRIQYSANCERVNLRYRYYSLEYGMETIGSLQLRFSSKDNICSHSATLFNFILRFSDFPGQCQNYFDADDEDE